MSPYRISGFNLHGRFAEVHRKNRDGQPVYCRLRRIVSGWLSGRDYRRLVSRGLTMKPREKRSLSKGRTRREGYRWVSSRLTTISIVYDFNNLGAALLARLDTFLVVNRATKSVFMGRSRPVSFLSFAFFACDSLLPLPSFHAAERTETTVQSWIDQKDPRWLGTDPLVPDRSELVARKTVACFPFLRAYTLARG